MRKVIIVIVLILMCFSVVSCGEEPYIIDDKETEQNLDYENIAIRCSAIQTHEYLDEGVNQICIDTKEELDEFNKSHDNIFKDYKNDLSGNILVIRICSESSGSNQLKVKGAYISDQKLCFDIERTVPEIGTCDMATWYLAVLVPSEKVEGVLWKE